MCRCAGRRRDSSNGTLSVACNNNAAQLKGRRPDAIESSKQGIVNQIISEWVEAIGRALSILRSRGKLCVVFWFICADGGKRTCKKAGVT